MEPRNLNFNEFFKQVLCILRLELLAYADFVYLRNTWVSYLVALAEALLFWIQIKYEFSINYFFLSRSHLNSIENHEVKAMTGTLKNAPERIQSLSSKKILDITDNSFWQKLLYQKKTWTQFGSNILWSFQWIPN